jgi:NADH:ubiquinone oxidoreductase subunit 2 (subunit N)
LITIIICFESLAFIFIGLLLVNFTSLQVESTIKYFVQNTVITGIEVFGVSLCYFISKSTNLALIQFILVNEIDLT